MNKRQRKKAGTNDRTALAMERHGNRWYPLPIRGLRWDDPRADVLGDIQAASRILGQS